MSQALPQYTLEEVADHARRKKGDAWIVVNGSVYDVKGFLSVHPGGEQIVAEQLGKDVTGLMHLFSHSEAAFSILEDYRVGKVVQSHSQKEVFSPDEREPNGFTKKIHALSETSSVDAFGIDLSRPLVAQVGYLGSNYDKWVHQASYLSGSGSMVRSRINGPTSPLFFQNRILERLTRSKWWMVPVVWVPVTATMLFLGAKKMQNASMIIGTLIIGVLVWGLIEYCLHRFVFHVETSSYIANTVHFTFHGCHHKFPMDPDRLVFPPVPAGMFAFVFYCILCRFFPLGVAQGIFAGITLGYVCYDCLHYYVHHTAMPTEYLQNLKRYHLDHHFKNNNCSFGISSRLYDHIFDTLPDRLHKE